MSIWRKTMAFIEAHSDDDDDDDDFEETYEKVKEENNAQKTQQAQNRMDHNTVEALYRWSCLVDTWGGLLVVLIILAGIILTMISAAMVVDDEAWLSTIISSIISWGLGAFLTYCGCRLTALLLRAVASITRSTMITANLALQESHRAAGEREKEIVVGEEGN